MQTFHFRIIQVYTAVYLCVLCRGFVSFMNVPGSVCLRVIYEYMNVPVPPRGWPTCLCHGSHDCRSPLRGAGCTFLSRHNTAVVGCTQVSTGAFHVWLRAFFSVGGGAATAGCSGSGNLASEYKLSGMNRSCFMFYLHRGHFEAALLDGQMGYSCALSSHTAFFFLHTSKYKIK